MDNFNGDDGNLLPRAQPYYFVIEYENSKEVTLARVRVPVARQISPALAGEDMAVNVLFAVVGA